jgi:Mn2+/Fe2+ NRAMP family transporter
MLLTFIIVEGDLLAGTHGGYGLIWTLFLATFAGLIIQIISARVGVVTGRDLGKHIYISY